MNSVNLIGNLVRDPELKTTAKGVYMCRFTIGVRRDYVGADGERASDFINCIAWRKNAENICKYLSKGKKVGIKGTLQSSSYEKDGRKIYSLDVVCDEKGGVEFLSPKGESAGGSSENAAAASVIEQTDAQSGYVQVDEDELPF